MSAKKLFLLFLSLLLALSLSCESALQDSPLFEDKEENVPGALLCIGYEPAMDTSDGPIGGQKTPDGRIHYRVFVKEIGGVGFTVEGFEINISGPNKEEWERWTYDADDFARWFDTPDCEGDDGNYIRPHNIRCADVFHEKVTLLERHRFKVYGVDDKGRRVLSRAYSPVYSPCGDGVWGSQLILHWDLAEESE